MNDINLNSPDLKLVRPSGLAPARAPTSPQAEGSNASARSVTAAPSSEPIKVLPLEQSGARKDRLESAVSQLNDFVQNVQRDLRFEVDHERGETIIRVVDQQTQEVIRQIPDEVALRLAENLQQEEPLTLFNLKV